jgi:hypothetical protein
VCFQKTRARQHPERLITSQLLAGRERKLLLVEKLWRGSVKIPTRLSLRTIPQPRHRVPPTLIPPRTNTATSWITIEPTNDNNITEDTPRTPNVNAFNEITQDELYQVVFLENAPSVSPPPPYNITATGADENGSEITIVGREVEDEDVAPTPARTPARTQAQTQSDRLERIRQRLRDFRDGVTASAPGMTRRTWRRRRGA